MGALITYGMLAVMLLTTIVTGLQVWLSEQPMWALFKASLVGLLFVLILAIVFFGREFYWWTIDGELLDKLAVVWAVLTIVFAAITYWWVR